MIKGIGFVLGEHIKNIYRVFTITKYEIVTSNRDTKIGYLWAILNPLIQIITYWLVFGTIRQNKAVDGVEFFPWLIAGIVVWFYMSAGIIEGTNSIHSKSSIITKIKFPISIIPTTKIFQEAFNNLCMFSVVYIVLLINGKTPSLYDFQTIYYFLSATIFLISLSFVTSVLNMITRDISKAIKAMIKILFYATPILWTMENVSYEIQFILRCNPIYYIVEGYRRSLLYNISIVEDIQFTIIFWSITLVAFILGSILLYRFRYKFIDLL